MSSFEPRPAPAPARPLEEFLLGGSADRASELPAQSAQETVPDEAVKPEPTVQKLFRLRWDTVSALRTGAAQESAQQGRRVTETEIVESLIRKRFKLPKL